MGPISTFIKNKYTVPLLNYQDDSSPRGLVCMHLYWPGRAARPAHRQRLYEAPHYCRPPARDVLVHHVLRADKYFYKEL